MAKGLSDDDIKALTNQEIAQSIGYFGGKLAEMRRKSEYYFLGLAKGDLSAPEIEGRSAVVDTTVRNTILWMLPALIKTFCAGDNVVEFTPTTEEDDEKAQLATDYINYLFYKQNPGFQIVNTWFTDALLQKVGFVKVWWDNRIVQTREEYRGMDDAELALLLDDDELEAIEHKQYPDEDAAKQKEQALQQIQGLIQQSQGNPQASQQLTMQLQQTQAMLVPMLHDVTVKRTKTDGKVCVENVPPEELLVSRYSKRIDDGFSAHRVLRTVSDLTAMGYKNVDMISSDNNDSSSTYNMEHVERVSYDDETPYIQEDSTNLDPTQRKVWLTECYLKADVDGDGISEWRKVVRAGDQILENVECDGPPFVSICPIPLPHRMFGLSIADLGMEPQRIQTSLLRAQLDNLYLSVNGRHFAVEGQVNLDDLLTSRPGGIVRVKAANMVGPIDTPTQDSRGAMEMMEWFQDFTENSTGWTRYSQGSNSESLNKTATGVNIITNKADQRLELISRQFAETGFTDLFKLMLKLTCQYQQKKKIIRLGDKWVDIDPREWRNQFDLSINVGLGTGNKDQQVAHLQMLHQQQGQGLSIGIAKPKNMYNSAAKLTQALGFKDPNLFWTDPSAPPDPNEPPPPPPPPDPNVIKAQQQDQQNQRELQFKAQQAQMEQQAKDQDAQRDIEFEQWKVQFMAQAQQQLEIIKEQAATERAKIAGEYALLIQQEKNGIDQQQIVTQAHVDLLKAGAEHERTVADMHITHEREADEDQITGEQNPSDEEMQDKEPEKPPIEIHHVMDALHDGLAGMQQQHQQNHAELLQALTRPKTIIRGPDGKVSGVQ